MSDLSGWHYGAIFAGTAFLSLVLTPLALRLAVRVQILDQPGEDKSHGSPVPYLGGLAIVLAFSAVVVLAATLRPPNSGLREIQLVMLVAVGLSIVGLFDDLKSLRPLVRLAVEVGAGVAVWQLGVGVHMFSADLPNAIVTVLWVVGITNAFNLLDNMDGLSAGVAAIAAGWFFVIAGVNGQFLVAALAVALAGCAVGFLRHNFHPARIYMGDSGSLFLGFVLAYLGVKLRFDGPTEVTFLVPILVLGVAIFDTTLVTVCRLLVGRSPFKGGLDHPSHRLVFIGIPVRAAVSLLYGAAVGLGVLGLVVSRIDQASAYMLAGLVVGAALFLAVLLARVPVYRVEGVAAETSRPEVPERNRQAEVGALFAQRVDR